MFIILIKTATAILDSSRTLSKHDPTQIFDSFM